MRYRLKVGKRDKLFLLSCLLFTLFNFFVPFKIQLDLDYSTIYRSGDEKVVDILPYGVEKRIQVPIDSMGELKPEFVNCILAAENKEFFKGLIYFKGGKIGFKNIRPGMFRGVPVAGLARSLFTFGMKGGGSGLVQQLAKNLVHEGWSRNAQQKYSEGVLSFALTSCYSNEELFLLYLNTSPVFFNKHKLNPETGQKRTGLYMYPDVTYGIKTASIRFFGTSNLRSLTLDQFATLVASLKGGSFRLVDSLDSDVKGRRNNILERMVQNGFLSANEALKYKEKPIVFNTFFKGNECYRSAIEFVRKEAVALAKENKWDTTLNGFRIKTTLSRYVQQAAADVVDSVFNSMDRLRYFNNDTLETGIAIINPVNGHLLGMIGDAEPYNFKGKFNHAYRDFHQIGSTMKPFVYGAFFEKGYTPETLLPDKDLPGTGDFRPSNYSGRCSNSDIAAKDCLKFSLNKPTANIVNKYIGVRDVISFMKRCGYNGELTEDKAMVLGTASLTPLELARAYAPLANGGNSVPVISITEIRDKNNKLLWKLENFKRTGKWRTKKNVFRFSIAKQVTSCLVQALETGGTGNSVRSYYKGIAAGKTGTTSNSADTWFVGYTPTYCGAIWMGGMHNSRMPETINTGGKSCAPVWGLILSKIVQKNIDFYTKRQWPWFAD